MHGYYYRLAFLHTINLQVIISSRALAWEGDYEMMPVCMCVRVCVLVLVSQADFSKTTAATDFL